MKNAKHTTGYVGHGLYHCDCGKGFATAVAVALHHADKDPSGQHGASFPVPGIPRGHRFGELRAPAPAAPIVVAAQEVLF